MKDGGRGARELTGSMLLGALTPEALGEEMAAAELGDKRRSRRVGAVVEQAARNVCGVSISDEAEREGYYRLIGNESAEPEAIFAAHVEATLARAQCAPRVLLCHDTTDFNFPRHPKTTRYGLAAVSARTQGFKMHWAFAVAHGGSDSNENDTLAASEAAVKVDASDAPLERAPLGLVAWSPYVYKSELEAAFPAEQHPGVWEFWRQKEGLWDNHRDRWAALVRKAEAEFARLEGPKPELVHVMDREGDCWQTLLTLNELKANFVIRCCNERRIAEDADDTPTGATGHSKDELTVKMLETLEKMPWEEAKRRVVLSARGGHRTAELRKRFPERRRRETDLSIRSMKVNAVKPRGRPAAELKRLPLWVIEVKELNPPEGNEPVVWQLLTNLALGPKLSAWDIVDMYRCRWTIEEFHKAVKTGCGFTKLQHRSIEALLTALALTVPVAWQLLALRYVERQHPDAPARQVVDQTVIDVAARLVPKAFPPNETPTVRHLYRAVAQLGGHHKPNGPPGWLVLGRGWQRLLGAVEGWEQALRFVAEQRVAEK